MNSSEIEELISIFFQDIRTIDQIRETERLAQKNTVDTIISKEFLERWNNENDRMYAMQIQSKVTKAMEIDGLDEAIKVAFTELEAFPI